MFSNDITDQLQKSNLIKYVTFEKSLILMIIML